MLYTTPGVTLGRTLGLPQTMSPLFYIVHSRPTHVTDRCISWLELRDDHGTETLCRGRADAALASGPAVLALYAAGGDGQETAAGAGGVQKRSLGELAEETGTPEEVVGESIGDLSRPPCTGPGLHKKGKSIQNLFGTHSEAVQKQFLPWQPGFLCDFTAKAFLTRGYRRIK